jgi:hypothetical protein
MYRKVALSLVGTVKAKTNLMPIANIQIVFASMKNFATFATKLGPQKPSMLKVDAQVLLPSS